MRYHICSEEEATHARIASDAEGYCEHLNLKVGVPYTLVYSIDRWTYGSDVIMDELGQGNGLLSSFMDIEWLRYHS